VVAQKRAGTGACPYMDTVDIELNHYLNAAFFDKRSSKEIENKAIMKPQDKVGRRWIG
jgi:hypothetical protein